MNRFVTSRKLCKPLVGDKANNGRKTIVERWLCLFLIPCALAAQNRIQFGLTPAMVVQEFKPGEPFSLELEVTNGNPGPVLMRGLAMDFWYDDKSKNLFAAPGTFPQSASNWLEFVPRQVSVPEKGSAKIRVVVTPPAEAVGSFYTVAFLESKPELTEPAHDGRKALYTNIRLGTLMLFAAEKSQKYNVDIADIKVVPPTTDTSFNLEIHLVNMSNTHIFPKPALLILDKDGHVVAKALGEIKRFMPGERKEVSVPWSGNLKAGDYEALLTLVYAEDKTLSKRVAFKVQAAEANVSTEIKAAPATTGTAKAVQQ